MNLRSRANRVLAGALAAVTISTTVAVSPPAEAWNPFSWVNDSAGSMMNRVVHGVLGGALVVGGVLCAVAGGLTLPLGFGIPLVGIGAAAALYGGGMLSGAFDNRTATNEWWRAFHSGSAGGSQVPRNSSTLPKATSAAAAAPGDGVGQRR